METIENLSQQLNDFQFEFMSHTVDFGRYTLLGLFVELFLNFNRQNDEARRQKRDHAEKATQNSASIQTHTTVDSALGKLFTHGTERGT